MKAILRVFLVLAMVVGTLFSSTALASASKPAGPGVNLKIITLKNASPIFSHKVEKCISRASKWEAPAPPADPRGKCSGKVDINAKAKVVASCKRGWWGGRAVATLSIRERIRVSAFAESFASISRVKVKTVIRDRIRGKVGARVDCVRIQNDTPPTPTPPPHVPPPYVPPPPPPPHVDHPPQVEIITPAHIFEGGNTFVYAKGYDPDGDTVSVNLFATGAAYISGVVRVNQYFDASLNGGQGAWVTCPAGWTCVRGQAWGQYSGYADVTATVVGNGISGEPARARWFVKPDQGF